MILNCFCLRFVASFLIRIVLYTVFMVFPLPQTLVKTLPKNLVKDLASFKGEFTGDSSGGGGGVGPPVLL